VPKKHQISLSLILKTERSKIKKKSAAKTLAVKNLIKTISKVEKPKLPVSLTKYPDTPQVTAAKNTSIGEINFFILAV
jgi:hypothetical protein